jgi:glycolate oxidase
VTDRAIDDVRRRLLASLRPEQVLASGVDRDTYDRDAFAAIHERPALVVLCASAADVVAAVRACVDAGVPFVPRGAGTGLSGGATPSPGSVVISVAGLRDVEVAIEDRLVCLGPGVTNVEVSAAVSGFGMHYAPDPSSQVVCTIGGNVAENSGGAHCLKYGFTTNHILGAEVVLPDATSVTIGGDLADVPGYDLRGVFVGSEGTLGIATRVFARVVPDPEAVRTALADFVSLSAAGEAVSGIVAAGIVPACLEMMDQLAMEACEAASGAGLPLDAAAALIIECDGPASAVDDDLAEITEICLAAGARTVRLAADDTERALIWKARKSAFAAMGRLASGYIVQDGVIPRTNLGDVLAKITDLAGESGFRVANVFHAGDGNLHPLVLYDAEEPGQAEAAEELSHRVIAVCVERGGSITGEHGVGVEKACLMPLMFSDDDLAVMGRVRRAFDPRGLCNPENVLPTPRLCGEVPGRYRAHPLETAGVASRW